MRICRRRKPWEAECCFCQGLDEKKISKKKITDSGNISLTFLQRNNNGCEDRDLFARVFFHV